MYVANRPSCPTRESASAASISHRSLSGVGASIPFGLAVAAREPISVDEVDLAALIYDPNRQITLVHAEDTGALMPWCKHSTGKTNTDSNTDGQGGRETDEDYTED
jgi:putative ATP-grasp target RiPP